MGKRIGFNEYQAVWMEYSVVTEISNEDYALLEKKEMTLSDIVDKYDIEYEGSSENTDCSVNDIDSEYENWYEE